MGLTPVVWRMPRSAMALCGCRPLSVVAAEFPRLTLLPRRDADSVYAAPQRRAAACAAKTEHKLTLGWFARPPPASTEGKSYQAKSTRWRPVFALETGGSPSPNGQDFEDTGFLGRTRLGRLIQAAARELLKKLNSARTKSPTKIFLVLLGFYTANALATILGQTGDWDVLVAGVIVAAIEGIGMLMYRKPAARRPGRFQSLISMINFWKAGVCLGLFVDAFKLGS